MIIYQKQYDAVYTYHADAQGNIVAISDADGRVVEKYAYDVYGRLTCAGIWNSGTQQYDAVATGGGFVSMAAYRFFEKKWTCQNERSAGIYHGLAFLPSPSARVMSRTGRRIANEIFFQGRRWDRESGLLYSFRNSSVSGFCV